MSSLGISVSFCDVKSKLKFLTVHSVLANIEN